MPGATPEETPRLLDQEAIRLNKNFESIVRDSMGDLVEALVLASPTESGLMRGSWKVGINEEPEIMGEPDLTGGRTIRTAREALKEWQPGQAILIGNTAKNQSGEAYANFVEFGTEKMRPRGFVRRTLAKFESMVNRNVAKYANR